MTAPQTEATTNPQSIAAALQQRLDAALLEKAALAEELAARTAELGQRNTEYSERIEHQAATIDVLKAMSASPGDPQPVFDLIARQAANQCNVPTAAVATFDGKMMHLATQSGFDAAYVAQFPRPVGLDFSMGRAVLTRRVEQVEDITADPGHSFAPVLGPWSVIAVPILRDGQPLGAITIGRPAMGPFSASQVALLQTFAEQAVIAITSAETYRALHTRTSDLQEALEYQTATSDVLKVISRTEARLDLALETLVATAARICAADQGAIHQLHDGLHFVSASFGTNREYRDYVARNPIAPGRGTAIGRMALERRAVHIEDVLGDPEYTGSEFQRLAGFRSVLAVPLFREDVVIGSILLTRSRVEPFTDKQIELVRTFADQAVIAIENARLITETREALERQTATAEVLQVINSSPGNLAPVFEAILDKAHTLCGATLGSLFLFDGELFCAAATHGYPEDLAQRLRQGTNPAATTQLLDESVPWVQNPDLTLVDGPTARAVSGRGGVRTNLMLPLRKDGRLLGAITCNRREVRPFTDKEIALLQNFAAQAVIAMENARLLTEQREALEQQTATAEVLQVINASPGDLAPVFDAILEKAHNLCGAPLGSLVLRDGEQLRAVATRGYPHEYETLARQGFSPTGSFGLLLSGEPFVHVLDGSQPPTAFEDHPMRRAAAEIAGVRTVLFVPLCKDETVLGYISAQRQEVRPFTDKQIALLQTFAAQAVIAMENARLITEQREALEQQTATAEVLQVINASPGNLTPVFDAILDKAHTLCGAAIGSLVLFDGTYFRVVATHGWPNSITALFSEPAGPNRVRHPVDGERFVQVADIRAIGRGPNSAWGDAVVESTDARTMLLVPLRKDGALLGFISAFRPEVRAFSDKEIALLENFAAQAVIAMENARLINEQREALEQQTATAEVLQVINSSPGDLTSVFDAALERGLRLCEAAFGQLWTYDGDWFEMVAWQGMSPGFVEFLSGRHRPGPGTLHGRLLAGEDVLHVVDMMDDELYRAGHSYRKKTVELGGARSSLAVALRKDKKLLGILIIYRQEVRPFTDKQIELLQNFAAQVVIAMENARLLTETREALEQQTATAEVLQVINANPGNLAPVFDALLEKALRLAEAAFGTLWTYDRDGAHIGAQRSTPAPLAEFRARTAGQVLSLSPAVAQVFATKRVLHQLDMREEEGYRSGHPIPRAVAERTLLIVPLVKEQTVLGLIQIYRQEVRAFSDKQIALLENFAAQAVIAMENARLINEQREALEQQTATAEVLQVINANPGDLAPVFDAMLVKAMRLCGGTMGGIFTFDGDHSVTLAVRGVTAAFQEYNDKYPMHKIQPGTVAARIIETRSPVQNPDVTAGEGYRAGYPYARALVELGGIRAVLDVPLLKDGVAVGMVAIYRREAGAFSDKEIALLENFAAQAVIAMENARLLEEVQQRQEELRITFENMGDGVAMFDETQHLVAWNRKFQEIFNVPDALLEEHRRYAEYVRYLGTRGDFGPTADVEEQIRRFTETAGEYHSYERVRPDGRVIEIRHNPVAGGGFVLIYADITERKQNEAEIRAARDAAEEASRTIEAAYRDLKAAQANLIQAEKMASLGQLTAGIAHEIKNPLNFVNNFSALSTELIDELRDVLAPEPLGETTRTEVDDLTALLKGNLEKVVQHGQRADGIVRSMLDHSRGSSGERRMVDLNALIDEALNLAYHGARAQDQSFNITLERDFGEGIAPIEVNPQDMTRVFLNLFSNGFYATTRRTRDGGNAGFEPTLKVTTRNAEEAVEIRVRDNGTGIPADIRDKLFQPFFTTKPTGEGTGLGLSITYDIVTQQHGGSITVDSRVGEYSEFTIQLPRTP